MQEYKGAKNSGLGGQVVRWMVRKAKDKDHLSRAQAEIWTELGKNHETREYVTLLSAAYMCTAQANICTQPHTVVEIS